MNELYACFTVFITPFSAAPVLLGDAENTALNSTVLMWRIRTVMCLFWLMSKMENSSLCFTDFLMMRTYLFVGNGIWYLSSVDYKIKIP